jgi:protein phosphatase 1G
LSAKQKENDLVTNFISSQVSIFGVFDGHGGRLVSQFVADNFIPVFKHSSSKKRKESSSGPQKSSRQNFELRSRYSEGSTALNIIEQILIQTFLDLDQMLMTKESYLAMKQYREGKRNDLVISDIEKVFNDPDQYFSCTSESAAYMMGTTAVVVSIYGGYAVVANVGDSMAVLYDESKAIILNTEHKSSIEGEKERILNSGFQIHNGRIDGKLNLTRAIGDLQFKDKRLRPYEQAVTAYPEILTYELTPTSEFLVIACDGIWDCVEPQKFCEFISEELKKQIKISDIIGSIQDMVLSKTINSPIGTDNMTCIVVQFKSFTES